MNIYTLSNVSNNKEEQDYSYIGFASNVLPEARCSKTGVSTRSALISTKTVTDIQKEDIPHWYALRATYGREKKAYDYIISQNGKAFYPTICQMKLINGKKKSVELSRLPNMLFAYGTEKEIQALVYDNVNLTYLRFYYRHRHEGVRIIKEPLVIPDNQIESLKIICASESEDVIVIPENITKFKSGDMVRIVEGKFAGVMGRVARYHGQQRVAVIIDGLLTIATAYIPSAFLNIIKQEF